MGLRQPNCAIILLLDLNPQEITNVSLIINHEVLRAGVQVIDYLVDGRIVGAKNDAVVNIHQEDYQAMVIKARVNLLGVKPISHVPWSMYLFQTRSACFWPYTLRINLKACVFLVISLRLYPCGNRI